MVEEIYRRAPKQGSHRSVVGTGIMSGKLSGKVLKGEESMSVIKTSLVLSVSSFHLAIMPRRVGANEFMLDAKAVSGKLKSCWDVPLGVGKAVGEFEAVVGLDALYSDSPAFEPFDHAFQEVGRGVC